MFETASVVSVDELDRLAAALCRLDASVDDAQRVDQIRALERVKAAAAAAQARATAAFAASQEAAQRARGVPVKHLGRGVAAQVGLARRESPTRA